MHISNLLIDLEYEKPYVIYKCYVLYPNYILIYWLLWSTIFNVCNNDLCEVIFITILLDYANATFTISDIVKDKFDHVNEPNDTSIFGLFIVLSSKNYNIPISSW